MKISLYTVIYRYQVKKYCLGGRNIVLAGFRDEKIRFYRRNIDYISDIGGNWNNFDHQLSMERNLKKKSEKSLKYQFWLINLQNICACSDAFLPIFSIYIDNGPFLLVFSKIRCDCCKNPPASDDQIWIFDDLVIHVFMLSVYFILYFYF